MRNSKYVFLFLLVQEGKGSQVVAQHCAVVEIQQHCGVGTRVVKGVIHLHQKGDVGERSTLAKEIHWCLVSVLIKEADKLIMAQAEGHAVGHGKPIILNPHNSVTTFLKEGSVDHLADGHIELVVAKQHAMVSHVVFKNNKRTKRKRK
jgi:hypothetical protein